MNEWTKEEIEYLIDKYKESGIDACVEHLGRSRPAVINKAYRLGVSAGRYFTDKEIAYIEKNVGIKSYSSIAKGINKPYESVKRYISRAGMSYSVTSCNRVHLSEFARLVGCQKATVYRTFKYHGLKLYKAGKYTLVDMDEAAEWLCEHPDRWDATKCQQWFFRRYPWFEEKRKEDFQKMVEKRWGA